MAPSEEKATSSNMRKNAFWKKRERFTSLKNDSNAGSRQLRGESIPEFEAPP